MTAIAVRVDKEIDCRGLLCPMPIIRTSKALKEVGVGQVLKIVATDAGFPADIQAWAKQTGHRLLGLEQEDDVYIAYVERSK